MSLERALLFALRLLVRVYFREIEVIGTDNVPRDRGGVLVAWHPNALVDPCLVTAEFPGRVVFGARHGLFGWPVLGAAMRALGAVPIYRAMDRQALSPEERREANVRSLSALASQVSGGAFAALFPEGLSHDEPKLAPVKTGAARLYYEARASLPPEAPAPVIVPVGLHYDEKHLFRSAALVWFHAPLELPPELDARPAGEGDEAVSEAVSERRVRELTARIERALEDAVHPTDDWRTHRLIHRVRKLVRAERARRAGAAVGRPTLEERTLGFARVQRAYYERLASDPERAAALRDRVERYDDSLNALGLDDHELETNPPIGGLWLLALTLVQFVFVFLLLPPLLLLGYLVNGTAALLVLGVTRLLARNTKDIASHKLLVGAAVFPLTWLAVIPLGALAHGLIAARFPALPDMPIISGVILSLASIAGGLHALRYQHAARRAWKNLQVRFRRRRRRELIAETLDVRAGIFDEVMELAEGLELPGLVSADGVVGSG